MDFLNENINNADLEDSDENEQMEVNFGFNPPVVNQNNEEIVIVPEDEFRGRILPSPIFGHGAQTNHLTTTYLRNSVQDVYDIANYKFADIREKVQESYAHTKIEGILEFYEHFEYDFFVLLEEQATFYERIEKVEASERQLHLNYIEIARKRQIEQSIRNWQKQLEVMLNENGTFLIDLAEDMIENPELYAN